METVTRGSGNVFRDLGLADADVLNHRIEIVEGVLGAECAELLQRFFNSRR